MTSERSLMRVLAALSTEAITTAFEEIDDGIHRALSVLGETIGADRAYLFRVDGDGELLAWANTHKWCATGMSSVGGMSEGPDEQKMSSERFAWFASQLQSRKPIIIADVAELPPEAAPERLKLEECQVRARLCIPLVHLGSVRGFVGFDMVYAPREWSDEEVSALRLAGALFVQMQERQSYDAERRSLERRVRDAELYDEGTGLPNRTLLENRLRRALVETGHQELLLGLLAVNLDRFRSVNESLGHDAGDQILRMIAGRLKEIVDESDTVARTAGDEFAIVLSERNHVDRIEEMAQRVVDVLAEPFQLGARSLYLTVSVGITTYPFDDEGTITLFRNAHAAMHRAKEAGGNRYLFYSPDMVGRARHQLAMQVDLRRALSQNEFVMFYQPVVAAATGQIVGAEALLRWFHPDKGLVSPADFIPAAEATGLIGPIMQRMMRDMLPVVHEARARNPGFRLAINLSVRQLEQCDFPQYLKAVLEHAGVDASWLEFEITESAILAHTDRVSSALKALRDMGATVALDDFGTGYSSLSYLRRFAIDTVKIDQSFVRGLPEAADVGIVRAIVSLGQSLKLDVVAEGVERPEQAAFLAALGCGRMQGYWFSRPVPEDQLMKLLKEGRLPVAWPSERGNELGGTNSAAA